MQRQQWQIKFKMWNTVCRDGRWTQCSDFMFFAQQWSLPIDVATIALVVKSARVKRHAIAQAYCHAEEKNCCLSASTFHALVRQLRTESDQYLQKPKQATYDLRSDVILLVM